MGGILALCPLISKTEKPVHAVNTHPANGFRFPFPCAVANPGERGPFRFPFEGQFRECPPAHVGRCNTVSGVAGGRANSGCLVPLHAAVPVTGDAQDSGPGVVDFEVDAREEGPKLCGYKVKGGLGCGTGPPCTGAVAVGPSAAANGDAAVCCSLRIDESVRGIAKALK